jgi:large subunit ribosomal protein L24
MRLKKNYTVIVISGVDKGKKGKILKVFKKENKVIVEGVNLRKKHQKPNQKNPQGGIIIKELPIPAAKVMLVDPKTGKPTRIRKQLILDEKTGKRKRIRISVKSGETIL